MLRILSCACALFLLGPIAFAGSKVNEAIQYIGAVSVNPSQEAKVLADWYERFGIQLPIHAQGGYFGTFNTAAGPVYFGIHARRPDAPVKSSGSVDIVLRVVDIDSFIANAAKNGVDFKGTESDPTEGRFAYYLDPDGNRITIWGK